MFHIKINGVVIQYYDRFNNKVIYSKRPIDDQTYLSIYTALDDIKEIMLNNPDIKNVEIIRVDF